VTGTSPCHRVRSARRDSSITALLPLASSVTGRQLEPSDVEGVAADGFAAAVKNQPDGDALLTDRGGELGLQKLDKECR
jgi:hypothetical protein